MIKTKFPFVLLFIAWTNMVYAQCPELIWQDEFDGNSLDTSKWSYEIGDGCEIIYCGWGNNELQWYQEENVEIIDGILRIIAKEEKVANSIYTSSRIRTHSKGDWTYGRFEASIKLPAGQGYWPAFWMLPSDQPYEGWPTKGEIDIMELVGGEPTEIHGTIHYGQFWPNNQYKQATTDLNEGEFQDDFHTFAVEWEEGEIRWLMDDHLYSTKRPEDLAPESWPFDKKFHILLNLAVGGMMPGNPDESTVFPQAMEVDYVRVYDGFMPSISGSHQVLKKAKSLAYSIHNAPENATFSWSIPEGAKLVKGQGSAEIIVDWGDKSGDLKVKIANDCQIKEIALNVLAKDPEIKVPLYKIKTLQNYDSSEEVLSYKTSSGAYQAGVKNPDENMTNSTQLVGKYKRNEDVRYDVLRYNLSNLRSDKFASGDLTFFVDLYTTAPIGTEVLVQLENSAISTSSDYPMGRHSTYKALTGRQNEWERLEFTLENRPDSSVKGSDVDQLLFLFAPNSANSDIFYMDNVDVYGPKSSGGSND